MWYALATYVADGRRRPAFVFGERMVDMTDAAGATPEGRDPSFAEGGLDGIIGDWEARAAVVERVAGGAARALAEGRIRPLDDGLRPALPFRPRRIFGAAANFVEHADEMGTVLAEKANSNPYIFLKAATSAVGDGDDVVKPPECSMLDWEVELGAVIGRRCRHLTADRAMDAVAGYTIVNDVSARDLNVRDDFPFKFDWFRGKSYDTFGPMGPWIVPASCFGDPHDVRLTLTVNDEVMQDGNTNQMIFNIAEQIAYLSNVLTLEPGDVIATGTPDGVGMGRGVFLKAGDVMIASVERIGSLTNPVVEAAGH